MKQAARTARLGYELAVALGLLLVIEVSLRSGTLPATCRRLRVRVDLDSPAPPASPPPLLPRWTRTRMRAALLATARWPAGDTCLRRCLLIGNRLRRLDPVLRIGVRRADTGAFSAHSWLEVDGRPLDVEAADFAVLGQPT